MKLNAVKLRVFSARWIRSWNRIILIRPPPSSPLVENFKRFCTRIFFHWTWIRSRIFHLTSSFGLPLSISHSFSRIFLRVHSLVVCLTLSLYMTVSRVPFSILHDSTHDLSQIFINPNPHLVFRSLSHSKVFLILYFLSFAIGYLLVSSLQYHFLKNTLSLFFARLNFPCLNSLCLSILWIPIPLPIS